MESKSKKVNTCALPHRLHGASFLQRPQIKLLHNLKNSYFHPNYFSYSDIIMDSKRIIIII